MSKEIIKVLDALAEKFGVAVDWTASNVIPCIEKLCGRYVSYEVATSIFWMLFGIGCLFLGKFLLKKAKYCYGKSDGMCINNGHSWGCVFAAIGFGTSIIVGVIVTLYQIFDIVTCFTFPEKIIIDEIKSIYSSINSPK